MTREEKNEIDRLVGIWITVAISPQKDAGWQQESILSRLITYQGDLPPPSGQDQSNLTMIQAMRLLGRRSPEYPRIAAAMDALYRTRPTQAAAIAAKNGLLGICPWTDKAWSDVSRAAEVDQSLSAYRSNLQRAYPSLEDELARIDTYKSYLIAAV